MCVRATSQRRLLASMPHADSTAESRGTITRSQIELARNIGHVQRGRAAEGENGEASRIDAAAHRNEPDALGHVRVDDAVDPLGSGSCDRSPSLIGDAIDGHFGGAAIEPRLAAEKLSGSRKPRTRLASVTVASTAAATVAGRARLRAGTVGPDVEDAAVVDARNRAAAGTDAGDVQALQRDALAGDAPVRC